MSTTSQVTAADLLALPSGMGQRYELVLGELRVMSPSGWRHGSVVGKMHTRLGSYVLSQGLGIVFGAETGFRLSSNPDTVRAPDVAFVSNEHIPPRPPTDSFWPGAPDLAIEILSPGDRMGEIDEKIEAWLKAGAQAVWIIDPRLQTVTIYEPGNRVSVKTAGQSLDGGTVVSGFTCSVDDLFR